MTTRDPDTETFITWILIDDEDPEDDLISIDYAGWPITFGVLEDEDDDG